MAGLDRTDPVRQEVVGFIRRSEETISDAGRRWAETFRDFAPSDGEAIRKAVGEAFDSMERILQSQREFANSVLDVVLREGTKSPTASKPASKPRTASSRPGTAARPRRTTRSSG